MLKVLFAALILGILIIGLGVDVFFWPDHRLNDDRGNFEND